MLRAPAPQLRPDETAAVGAAEAQALDRPDVHIDLTEDAPTVTAGRDVPVSPAENLVATWIFLNPGGKHALPHLYEGEPVDVMFRFDHTTPGGTSWRDRLVTAVRTCCPSRRERLVDFDDGEFEVYSVPPLVAAWLEWLTDDGSYGIAVLTTYEGATRVCT